jgi:hypothetical protein
MTRRRLTPFSRDIDGAVLGVELVAVDRQQFARAQHGGQRKLEREPRFAIPRHVIAVEAVPEDPDLVLGQHAVAWMFLVELFEVDAR